MIRESEAGYKAGCTVFHCEHFPDFAVDLLVMLKKVFQCVSLAAQHQWQTDCWDLSLVPPSLVPRPLSLLPCGLGMRLSSTPKRSCRCGVCTHHSIMKCHSCQQLIFGSCLRITPHITMSYRFCASYGGESPRQWRSEGWAWLGMCPAKAPCLSRSRARLMV